MIPLPGTQALKRLALTQRLTGLTDPAPLVALQLETSRRTYEKAGKFAPDALYLKRYICKLYFTTGHNELPRCCGASSAQSHAQARFQVQASV